MPTRKTLQDLQYKIAGSLNRQPSTFIVNSQNNLLSAINNAKDFIQRAIDFEYSRVSVLVPNVQLLTGGNLDNAVLFEEEVGAYMPGGQPFYGPALAGNPVQVCQPSSSSPPPCDPPSNYRRRNPPQYPEGVYPPNGKWTDRYYHKEENGWESVRSSWSMDDCPPPSKHVDLKKVIIGYLPFIDNTGVVPMTIYSKQEWADRRRRLSNEFTSLRINEAKALLAATGFGIIMDGKKFFVDPQSPQVFGWQSALNVYFDGYRWLEDFDETAGCEPHQQFLLDYCSDLLFYRAIMELNFFLKEDERVSISNAAWNTAWSNVVQWNATIFGNTTDVSLD